MTTLEGAQAAIAIADDALSQLNATRSELGSLQNQLTATIDNLATTEVNITAAASEIADADLAEESMLFARMKVLLQAQTFAMAI